MEDSFKSLIASAKSILILLPEKPNFDQVASGLSLFLALGQEQGKEVNVFCSTQMVVEFNRLVGVNKIKNELGNKNLGISFSNYNPQGIEKVSWDIDNGEFKLTIVPKPNVIPPTEDQVHVSYAGVATDLVILVGGTNDDSFPALKTGELVNAKLVHVGISELRLTGKTVSSLATAGSCVSEVVSNLIKKSGYEINADIATDLLMGIEEGTGGFAGSGVSADTFGMIADLMRAGGKRLSQGQVEAKDYPVGAIPGAAGQVPSSWTEPKIFKGTSVS